MVNYEIFFSPQAKKDIKKLSASNLRGKAQVLLDIIAQNPYKNPPPYKKLCGNLSDAYSRRINDQHRIVYYVYDTQKIVKVVRMWTHYE